MILDAAMLADSITPPEPAGRPAPVKVIWGMVAGVAPLRIRLDGDDDPQPYTPLTLAAGLTVGVRVVCLLLGGQLIVLGTPQV